MGDERRQDDLFYPFSKFDTLLFLAVKDGSLLLIMSGLESFILASDREIFLFILKLCIYIIIGLIHPQLTFMVYCFFFDSF